MSTTQIVCLPERMSKTHREQMVSLIMSRNKLRDISAEDLNERILRSYFVAYTVEDEQVVATAVLKNPFNDYRRHIFASAQLAINLPFYKELGYVATAESHEGRGLCKAIISKLFEDIKPNNVFMTTRTPAMINIGKKMGFKGYGEPLSGSDDPLVLMVYKEEEETL